MSGCPRSPRRAIAVVCLLCIGSTAPAPAWARPDEAAARALAEEALEHAGAADYRRAARTFERAFERVPKPAYAFNAGRMYDLLGEPLSAVRAYRRALEQARKPDRRAPIEAELAAALAKLATLTVAVDGDGDGALGTTLKVDGDPDRCALAEACLLVPGRHFVEVSPGAGRPAVQRVLDLRAGQTTTERLRLVPGETALEVDASVRGASVFLDGALVGVTPCVRRPQQAGTFVLRVEAEGHVPHAEERRIEPGQRVSLHVTLAPLPPLLPPGPSRGGVVLRSALFPGWGQLHAERSTAGAVWASAGAVAALATLTGAVAGSWLTAERDGERDLARWNQLEDWATGMYWLSLSAGIAFGAAWGSSLVHAALLDLPPATARAPPDR